MRKSWLPVGDDDSRAVTLDLNGEVLLRARAKVGTPATEVHLSNSHLSGSAVRLVSDRKFLGRALALGFTELSLYVPEAIVQAHDERRTYIWMPWSADGAVPADADTRRVTSTLGGTVPAKRRRHVTSQSVETISSETVTQPQQQRDSYARSSGSASSRG